MAQDPWHYYSRALDSYADQLDQLDYAGVAPTRPKPRRRTEGFFTVEYLDDPLTPESIKLLLSENAVGPPHGFELLEPLPLPKFPTFPKPPETSPPIQKPELGFSIFGSPWRAPKSEVHSWAGSRIVDKENALQEKATALRRQLEEKYQTAKTQLDALRARCEANDYEAVRLLINLSHVRHKLPYLFRRSWEIYIDKSSRILLCTFEIPDFNSLQISKYISKHRGPVSVAERKRSIETIVYSLSLRAAYLAAKSDVGDWFDTIAVNATQKWNDPATGQAREGIIASLQVQQSEIAQLNLHQVDPRACFRHLKGLSTPSIENVTPIRPIFVLNKNDRRIVQERDVAQDLEPEANIAAMPWEDFEHLVRQLFEWEFGRNGVEVKVFRLSRDHGVDAVMYDPDPLRGGKYVVQAKRYTGPVDVAAVRDLYGTVVNEGANRGILVTTSSFGPDAYDFAKDKPISLVDGPNLIAMLRRHGHQYRIDLEEARRLQKLENGEASSPQR
jgi:restriction system protein